jgi:hypothetical protein
MSCRIVEVGDGDIDGIALFVFCGIVDINESLYLFDFPTEGGVWMALNFFNNETKFTSS